MTEINTALLPVRDFEVGDNALSFDAAGNVVRSLTKPSESFDSLTTAIAFVTANPDSIERLSTASYRDESECTTLGIDYPDGGGGDYVVESGSGDGYINHTAGLLVLKLSFAREINARQAGAVGGANSFSNITAALASKGTSGVDLLLDENIELETDSRILIPSNTTIKGGGLIKASDSNTVTNGKVFGITAGRENILIDNVTVDGNVGVLGDTTPLIQLFNCSYVEIKNCKFKNNGGIANNISTTTDNVNIHDNEYDNIGFLDGVGGTRATQAIAFSSGGHTNTTVDRNSFKRTGLDCISLGGMDTGSVSDNWHADDQCYTLVYNSIGFTCTNFTIARNKAKTAIKTVGSTRPNGAGIDLPSVINSTVSGNVCKGCAGPGIGIFLASGLLSVTGNTALDNNQSGDVIHDAGIVVRLTTGPVLLSGNLSGNVDGSTNDAAYIIDNAQGSLITLSKSNKSTGTAAGVRSATFASPTDIGTTIFTYEIPFELAGNGSPEGVTAAPLGSTFDRLDGGVGTTRYYKESGSGNTGWSAKYELISGFKSFDSLTSAIAFVTANPAAIEGLTTASYRNEAECTTLGIDYPDGGGADYVVDPAGTGADNGISIIDAGSAQLKIVDINEVSSRQAGCAANNIADDSMAISDISATGIRVFRFTQGRYLFDSDVVFDDNTQILIDKDVWFTGSGRIKGNIPTSYGSISQVVAGSEPLTENGGVKIDTYSNGGKAYLSNYISLERYGAPTASTETDVLRIGGKTYQESDYNGFRAGLVGIHANIAAGAGNLNSRIWGLNPYMELPPGTDGLLHGCEVNIINYGSEVKVMNALDAKYGYNATSEAKGHTGTGYPATGAYKIGTGSSPEDRFWTGLWAGETSLVGDAAAQFVELDKRFGVNKIGTMGLGIEYSHADYTFTINGDGDYVHADAATNPDQYGQVVATSLGQLDAKILLNSGLGKSSQVTYAGQLTGSIYSQGRDDTDGAFKLVAGTNIRTGVELLSVSSSGNAQLANQLALGSTANDPVADGVVVVMQNVTTAPSATVAGQGVIYVEGGALKFRGGSGTITTIAPA